MKTFKQFKKDLSETSDLPRSESEKRFIRKHTDNIEVNDVIKNPKTSKQKDRTRKADLEVGEDESVYEENLSESKVVGKGLAHFTNGENHNVTSEEEKLINNLFSELSGKNKKTMEKTLKGSKKGYMEILKFAKEVE